MKRAIFLALLGVAAGACGTSPAKTDDTTDASVCPAPFAECDGRSNTVCETRLDTDPASCGACGKACPGGAAHQIPTCNASTCGLACEGGFLDCDGDAANGCEATVAMCGSTVENLAMVASPGGIAVDADFVYYGAKGSPPDYFDGALYKIPKSGGVPTPLATGLNHIIKIRADGDRVYWANGGHVDLPDGSVASVSKNGGPITAIASGMLRPNNVLIVGPLIYWTTREQPAGRVLSARKDGSGGAPTVVAEMLMNPSTLALAGTKLVFGTSGTEPDEKDALVEQMNLDGTERVTLARGITAPGYQFGIGTDAVFVGSNRDGAIYRVPFDTSLERTVVADGLGEPQELVLDGTTLYAVTGKGKRVVAVSLDDGGGERVIAGAQTSPNYLAADAEYVYWLDGALAGAATLRRAKKSGK